MGEVQGEVLVRDAVVHVVVLHCIKAFAALQTHQQQVNETLCCRNEGGQLIASMTSCRGEGQYSSTVSNGRQYSSTVSSEGNTAVLSAVEGNKAVLLAVKAIQHY
jgi:hypothetical protein